MSESLMLWIHGAAVGALVMNFYWRTRITRLEREQASIRRQASNPKADPAAVVGGSASSELLDGAK